MRTLRESFLGVRGNLGMLGIESARKFGGRILWQVEMLVLRCSDNQILGKYLRLFALNALVPINTGSV